MANNAHQQQDQKRSLEAARSQVFGEYSHPSFEAHNQPSHEHKPEQQPVFDNPRAFRHRVDSTTGYTQEQWSLREAERLKVEGLSHIGSLVDGMGGLREMHANSQFDLRGNDNEGYPNQTVGEDYDLAA